MSLGSGAIPWGLVESFFKNNNKKGCEHMDDTITQVATEVVEAGLETVQAPALAPEGFEQTAEDLGLSEQAKEQENVPL